MLFKKFLLLMLSLHDKVLFLACQMDCTFCPPGHASASALRYASDIP